MKNLKRLTTLLIVVIMILQVILPTVSYAAENIKLNIKEERPYSDDDGNGIADDAYTLIRNITQTVFKIGEQADDGTLTFNNAYYCLRGGLGFGAVEISQEGVIYNHNTNLKEKEEIIKYYKDNIDYEMPGPAYNAICWLTDNIYLPKSEYAEEMKLELLAKATKYKMDEDDEKGKPGYIDLETDELTDDDIEVAQQIALWHFSNADEVKNGDSLCFGQTVDLQNMLAIHGKKHTDINSDTFTESRAKKITKLYTYLIETAKENAATYNEVINPEIKLASNLNPTIEQKTITGTKTNAEAYVIGPFKINEIKKGNIDYKLTYELNYKSIKEQEWKKVQINNTIGTVYISDEKGNELYERTLDIPDMVGNGNFYITVLKNIETRDGIEELIDNIEQFKLEIKESHYNTISSVYWSDDSNDQTVLKIEKTREVNSDTVTVEKEQEVVKEFDLALRKFITKINEEEINSRVPKIYLNTLKNGIYSEKKGKTEFTATYNHPKNSISLKKGDNIVYTIRVYNEGELDGYASEITDYICDNLEFVDPEDSEINSKYNWKKENGKITTDYLKNTKIKAYNSQITSEREDIWQKAEDGLDGGLYYADLQIECKIKNTAVVGEVLPNIAEISKAIAIDENEIEIDIPDRDSLPDSLKEDDIRYYDINNENNSTDVQDDDDYEKVEVEQDKVFDLALRKYITHINDSEIINTRVPDVKDIEKLDNGTSTTATYNHRKDPVVVETGDLVTYNLTIYNEGEVKGRATKIVDQLPKGLKFIRVESENYVLENYDENINKIILAETNANNNIEEKAEGRKPESITVTIICEVTAKVKGTDQVLTNIAWIAEAYNADTATIITNQKKADRDSEPYTAPNGKTADELNTLDIGYTGKDNYMEGDLSDSNTYFKGEQDDDDFEKIVIKAKTFDLALRKFITNTYRKNEGTVYIREPQIDISTIKETPTTATYNHPKTAVSVKQGDIVKYKIRVYNEGELDGYATKVTDYLPEGLGFLNGYSGNSNWLINSENVESKALVGEEGWFKTVEDARALEIFKDEDLSNITIVTGKKGNETANRLEIEDSTSLKDALIKRYGAEVKEGDKWQQSINDENDGLFYEEIEVTCIVLAPNTWEGKIANIAEISGDKAVDENGEELDIDDRDSYPDSLTEEQLKDYDIDNENNSTDIEDDDDYEPLELKYFDLALRKFITGVNDQKVDTRVPKFYKDEEGNYKYRHDKTPVEVVDNDDITYTIRIFNEGTIAGYAEEIEDDIPEGLIFLPENDVNKEYGWKMYYRDENGELIETDDIEKATVIRTTYLSEDNGTIDETTGENSNILKIFNMSTPDFKDVQVVFKVSQNSISEDNTDRIITNKAHITKDSDDDEDSTPDEWNEGEDDQDIENVYVQKFDLALFKWVTKTIVTVDGKTATTETGFKPNTGKTAQEGENYRKNSEKEPIAAVTIDKKKLKSTVVKFVYNIKVKNEGEISGYATEITDYIPEGLKFVAEDENNKIWKLNENGTITTRALETVCLEPGQSVTIPVTFTWINDSNNLGLKTNIAEITEDYNEKGVKDIDSEPKNGDIKNYDKEQEDDDDFALVILTLKTGISKTYLGLIAIVITIIAAGAITIKKYVL